jgi:crotonobetainyl-CoA:carnitine CoA-transferase CaiB-like acyl-CoA transferase
MGGSAFSPPIGPVGYGRILASTRGPFRTADGFLSLVVYTDRHWRDFSALVGCPDLLDRDERFATPQNRNLNAEETGTFIAAQLTSRTNAEWLAVLEAIDIPASPVNSLQDLFDDPHLREVGLFATMQHPTEGDLNVTRFPARFSETPAEIRRLAPNLGAHNREVLGDAATA